MSESIDYQALFRSAPTAFVVLDPDLVIAEANDAYLAATARTRQELVGRPVFEAFPDNPEDPGASGVTRWGASLRRVLRERVVDVMEIQKYDIPLPGGGFDVRYWAPVNAPVFDPDGRLRWIVHRTEDVTAYVRARQGGTELAQLASELRVRTEQMEAEVFARRSLQREHEALQAVVDSLEVAVVGSDDEGHPVVFNDTARELIGPRIAEMPASEWGQRLHLYHADGRPIDTELPLLRALRGERVRDAEVVRRFPGQPQRFFRVHSRPVVGAPGVAAVVAVHDLTVTRRVARFQECELAIVRVIAEADAEAEVLGHAVELIGSLIGWDVVEFWSCDERGQVLRRVSRWADPAQQAPLRLPDVLGCGQDLPGRAWRHSQSVWVADLHTDEVTRDSGDWGSLHTALAVPVPTGPHVLGVLVCYSETIELPDDVRSEVVTGIAPLLSEFLVRRRAERLAADLDRAHEQYIALAGHEIRTPLTSIQAYTDLLLDEPDLSGDQRDMLTVMQRNAASLRAVILKLLDVAALRAGHLDVRPQPMDLAAVAREAVEHARDREDAHPIRTDIPGSARIAGDPARLRQVLDELLANALTWADDDSPVRVELRVEHGVAALSVCDTGPEIRADEHDRLFDMFYRGEEARRRGVPGSGLGLSLARAIVEQHGGTIGFSSAGDRTTTFTVRLPALRQPHPGGATVRAATTPALRDTRR
ncbi:sensor histidine kinase [Actinoplanes teichomyceticus]|uniref:Sensor-like histidine kinase SenX3 n=1 Tax=Actinoplanes teichomyceticus TaxID=1867 RepID=A0A561VCS7_ACTTI|nr:ATP-binding protein [Actinoplanes teichomyceticus]TWG09418.1 signal transduction histidine kinase [Actinoplanes teichomyceticus]